MAQEIKKALTVLIALVGIVGSIVTILASPSGMKVKALIIVFGVAIIITGWLVYGYIYKKRKTERQIPSVHYLEELSIKYRIDPATKDDIEWIAQLESEFYSAQDAIPKDILKEWYDVNPSGFFVIKMNDSRRIGHLDILPLRPKTLTLFLEGHLVERDIRGDSLYSVHEIEHIKNLYVESIILDPPEGCSRGLAILFLLCNFTLIVNRICDSSNLESVYAIAASKSGQRLMGRLGFNKISTSENRKDGHNLFAARYSELTQNINGICDRLFKQRL
jgi:hypothetical protein